ncbi:MULTISPECIES: head-tail connector protein [Holospora]|uniref:Phage gp6-like head-tail connector protein n=2 Tax=Holospora TaxID=44747 RepID=A0A061JFX7_9PROT|nr:MULTISPECIES: hypothetical protein [Holospora]ETZ04630.1 hypothetical protein K737_300950 [Holospora undulata HU1]GAJ46575.1 hypothetical protein HE1_00910 [Holospora elegans E1]
MTIIVIRPNQGTPIDLTVLKSLLPLGSYPSQATLDNWINVAVQWLEMRLNQAFLTQAIQVISRNNRIPLSRSPFVRLTKVEKKGKLLEPSQYTLEKNSCGIEEVIVPFQWKSPSITVEYEAGYGNTFEAVPIVFRQVIMNTVKHLCENGGDPKGLSKSLEPWLAAGQRSYRLW